MASPATIVASEESGALIMRAEGSWLVASATELDRRLHGLDLPTGRRVTLDLAGVDRLDTAGAWLLLRTEHALSERGNSVALANVRDSFAPLLDQVRSRSGVEPLPHPIPPHHTLVGFVARIGEITIMLGRRIYSMLGFGGVVSANFAQLLWRPR
jgi:phospholipid/cholesterol/gamma-HCH transport system permease protein